MSIPESPPFETPECEAVSELRSLLQDMKMPEDCAQAVLALKTAEEALGDDPTDEAAEAYEKAFRVFEEARWGEHASYFDRVKTEAPELAERFAELAPSYTNVLKSPLGSSSAGLDSRPTTIAPAVTGAPEAQPASVGWERAREPRSGVMELVGRHREKVLTALMGITAIGAGYWEMMAPERAKRAEVQAQADREKSLQYYLSLDPAITIETKIDRCHEAFRIVEEVMEGKPLKVDGKEIICRTVIDKALDPLLEVWEEDSTALEPDQLLDLLQLMKRRAQATGRAYAGPEEGQILRERGQMLRFYGQHPAIAQQYLENFKSFFNQIRKAFVERDPHDTDNTLVDRYVHKDYSPEQQAWLDLLKEHCGVAPDEAIDWLYRQSILVGDTLANRAYAEYLVGQDPQEVIPYLNQGLKQAIEEHHPELLSCLVFASDSAPKVTFADLKSALAGTDEASALYYYPSDQGDYQRLEALILPTEQRDELLQKGMVPFTPWVGKGQLGAELDLYKAMITEVRDIIGKEQVASLVLAATEKPRQ